MKAIKTVVVTCDDKHARFFENHGVGKGLSELGQLDAAEKQGSDYADRTGRGQAAPGAARHAFERQTDEATLDRRAFAAEVGARLVRLARGADRIGLVAAPAMLGELRRALPIDVAGRIGFEVDKDLTKSSAKDLAERLGDVAAF